MSDLNVPPENPRGGTPRPLSERLGLVFAVSGSAGVIVSFVYDWGFFFALGIAFSEAPTGISDHVRGWLIWLPIVIAPALFLLAQELLVSRLERGLTEEEIIASSPNPTRTRRRRNRPPKIIAATAVVLFLLWLVFGELFSNVRPLAVPIVWVIFVQWVFRDPRLDADWSASAKNVVIWVPAVFFLVFFYGAWDAKSEMSKASPSYRIELNTMGEEQAGEEVRVLRSFQDWILVRDSDQKVAWIHSNDVARIERLEASEPFQGLVCVFSSDWCLSKIRRQALESSAPSEALH